MHKLFHRIQIKEEQICEVPNTEMLLPHGFCSHVHTMFHHVAPLILQLLPSTKMPP